MEMNSPPSSARFWCRGADRPAAEPFIPYPLIMAGAKLPSATARQRLRGRVRQDAFFFLIAGLVIALDQLTKVLVRHNLVLGESWPNDRWLVKITHVTNSGAAFGILQGQGAFLTVTAFFGMAAIVFYYAFPPLEHGLLRAALGLQLGGAIGNLIDRLRFGEVTDFIQFPHYPAFNIADSSISIGLIVIVAFFALSEGRKPEVQTNDG
jgi:signal peptidase II